MRAERLVLHLLCWNETLVLASVCCLVVLGDEVSVLESIVAKSKVRSTRLDSVAYWFKHTKRLGVVNECVFMLRIPDETMSTKLEMSPFELPSIMLSFFRAIVPALRLSSSHFRNTFVHYSIVYNS